jgi:curved DNA-binding protein CbpA
MNIALDKAISLLGLTRADQLDEKSIQKAWKRKLLKVHPDKSNLQDATRVTQEINAAKDLLLIQSRLNNVQANLGPSWERARQAERERWTAEQERQAKQAERERQAKQAERERQAKQAERAKQAAASAKHDLFRTLHAQRSTFDPPAPDFQQSIHECMQENMNYENIRRTRQLQARTSRNTS